MNGRLEREIKEEKHINEFLKECPPILSDYYIHMRASKKSFLTMRSYIHYVKNFCDFINIGDDFYKKVTPIDVERYMISLETRTVNGTIVRTGDSIQATRWSALNSFFDYLENIRECIDKNPVSKVRRPTVSTEASPVVLNENDINRLKEEIDINSRYKTRDKTILSVFLSTGLRISAITQMNVGDIDLTNKTIRVIEKRQKTRYIPFGDNLKNVLDSWVSFRKRHNAKDDDPLFLSEKLTRISNDAVRSMIESRSSCLGKKVVPHTMRKTAATQILKSGIDINTASKMLGHASVVTTQRYLGAIDENKNKAVAVLDKIIS